MLVLFGQAGHLEGFSGPHRLFKSSPAAGAVSLVPGQRVYQQ